MPAYTKEESKDWAREKMRGVCNVLMPSFSNDLSKLNEEAIRHDVRKCKEYGFWGTLAVSECGTTMEEYLRFVEIAKDEGGEDFHLVVHGSFDTMEETIKAGKAGAAAGASLLLMSYPPTFYPTSEREVYDYSTKVMDEVPLATVLFSVGHWNFARLHPAELSPRLVAELADHPRAVALKCEGGLGNGAHADVLRLCGDKLLISDPREATAPGHVQWFGMQWMGTSVFQYYGDAVPKYFDLMHQGKWDEAMEIYWRLQPARTARQADTASYSGAHFIHRQSWKYMEWLAGFNGGRLRMPTMRLNDGATRRLAEGAVRAGIIDEAPAPGLNEFFLGRNPM
ncbi:dihydrodipicolinate synthase family protein [Amycolatopsis acidicola]|uniref:Dihydrodipicolinate synthase family protein n=1 Tax=Amycolatopsis acidicola TaxID=2596893 RepID=A0A5N0V4R4_9PSEU|nr:dihydrodipicolinate synthase family protein [Amycolatopsis acidicola]KAA9159049.1 dihydrodipicolinate synthase family protein [Amycolatopsis acidicola]